MRHDLAMLHGEHHRLEAIVRQFVDDADAIFVQRVLAVGDRIVDHHIEEAGKLAHEVDDLGVARVGQFSLKVKPMTRTSAPSIFSLRLSMALMTSRATKPAMPSLMRRPARIISGWKPIDCALCVR